MRNEYPKISIVTVVYNGEETIEETILSVKNLSYSNVEYIIIDGGSTDETLNIIKKYEDKIDYWISEKDNGIYDAMNKGIKKATSEFVIFMNGGDTFFDENVLANIEKDLTNDFDIYYGDNYKVKENGAKRLKSAVTLKKVSPVYQYLLKS